MEAASVLNKTEDFGLVVDSFAGGGGAGFGIREAIGRDADIAINHDPDALKMYGANHPGSRLLLEDVWKSDLRAAVGNREVGLLWASPDCKHFSRAKGSKPVNKRIRSLAWVVIKWADQVRPRMIFLENVREFAEWGPLLPAWRCSECKWRGTEGQATLVRTRRRCPRCESTRLKVTDELIPDPTRKGLTFRRWVGRLRNLGYDVQWRNLNAADYGAPTHRRRLFLIARCDGQPISWPEPTHGDPAKIPERPLFETVKPWRTAAECIDWSIPCPSIFDRKTPLVEKTMRRIAMGIKRYVLEAKEPYVVSVPVSSAEDYPEPKFCPHCGSDKGWGKGSRCKACGIVGPYIVGSGGPVYAAKPRNVNQPMGSILAENHSALVSPYLVPVTHSGERRPHSANEPAPTITSAHRGELAMIAPCLMRYNSEKSDGETRSKSADEPLGTVTTENRFAIVAPTLIQTGYGERDGQAPRVPGLGKPLGTVVSGGAKHALVAAFLAKHFGGQVGCKADSPLPTTTVRGTQNQLVAANLIRMSHGEKQWNSCEEPLCTITSQGNKFALIYSFLIKYFGTAIGHSLTEPLFTITGKDRFGLVTVTIDGDLYVIADIGMRMLTPRELARAQGFPDGYFLTGTKTSQVARIGNSVPPVMAQVLVGANLLQGKAACA